MRIANPKSAIRSSSVLAAAEMEFKPKPNVKDEPEPVVPPEKSRPSQRKTAEKWHMSYNIRRRLATTLKLAGKVCLFAAALGLLLGSIFVAYTSAIFTVRDIAFEGCKRADVRKLEDIIRGEFSSHILRIDLPSLRDRLEKEPWVRQVEVRRILPSDLIVSVQERTPAAILEIHGELMVADVEGILLDRYQPNYGKLDVPVFKGLVGEDAAGYRMYQEENAARVKLGLKMLAELDAGSPSYAGQISEVDISDRSNLKLLLVDDTPELIVGDRDFLKRFGRFVSNTDGYRQAKLKYGEMTSIDLRFDGEIVYHTRRPPLGGSAPVRP
jgi:cell division protein FtsQ